VSQKKQTALRKRTWVLGGLGALGLAAVVAIGAARLRGEESGKKPLPEIMKRMQYYNRALGVDCFYCHVGKKRKQARVVTPRLRTAKWMQEKYVDALVTKDGQKAIDCLTCHEGQARFLPSSQ